jgi:hydrogenase nickel incorporation protein HypA/HybF
MHEFSIADEIVKAVLNATKKRNGKKVLSVQLEVGELTHLNGEQVAFWVKELFKNSAAESAEVKIKTIKARIRCKACGYKGGLKSGQEDSFQHLGLPTCPRCNSFQFQVQTGQGCVLKRIQMLK